MPDIKSPKTDTIISSLVKLISENGRYSKEEILKLRALAPIQIINHGIFAITRADIIEAALEQAISDNKLREYSTASGYKTRFGIPGASEIIDELRVVETVYSISNCGVCGKPAIVDENNHTITHPLHVQINCNQRDSFIRIREREASGSEEYYYLIGNRCFVGVIFKRGSEYKLRLPGACRISGQRRVPEIVRAWHLLVKDGAIQRRIRDHYAGVSFSSFDILGIITSLRYGGRK